MTTAEDAIQRLPDLVNADAALVRRARYMDLTLRLGVGVTRFYVSIAAGRIAAVERGTQILRRSCFGIAAAPQVWLDHWRPVPQPGDHDLLALVKGGRAEIEGDVIAFMRHLQNVKDMLAKPRLLYPGET